MATPNPNHFEVYIRFNKDEEKDYCFDIDTDTKFTDLYKIFETLPIALRPSIFYKPKPTEFAYTVSPGYLTASGKILTSTNADRQFFKRLPKSQDDKICNYVWPGQLILPQWKFDHVTHLGTVALLLAWLYTDLPDAYSPTPGICLTNQLAKLVMLGIEQVTGNPNHVYIANIAREIEVNRTPLIGQIVFFVFHSLKVLIIYGSLYFGVINPMESSVFSIFYNRIMFLIYYFIYNDDNAMKSVNPQYRELTPDDLVEIGWTGSKKDSIEDYQEAYKNAMIEFHGGIVKTHQKGLIKDLNKNMGVYLDLDEGFGTPLPENHETEILKYPLSIFSVHDFPDFLKSTVSAIEAEEKNAEKSQEDDSKFNPLFTDSPKGKFKFSYKYVAYNNIAFLKNNQLLDNESLRKGHYSFNANKLVKNFRMFGFGVYGAETPEWKRFFNHRVALGNFAKGDRFSDLTQKKEQ